MIYFCRSCNRFVSLIPSGQIVVMDVENFRKTSLRSWTYWCTCLLPSFPAFLVLLRNYPARYGVSLFLLDNLWRWLNLFFISPAISKTLLINTKTHTFYSHQLCLHSTCPLSSKTYIVMSTMRVASPRVLLSGRTYIGKAITSSLNGSSTSCTTGLRSTYHLLQPYNSPLGKRKFSSTTKQQLEVFPPPTDAPSIRVT